MNNLRNAIVFDVKILSEYYELVCAGVKTAEVRKNDRDYRRGDILRMHEFDGEKLTGKCVNVLITHVLTNEEYVKEGFCVLSFQIIAPRDKTVSVTVWGNIYQLYLDACKERDKLKEGMQK